MIITVQHRILTSLLLVASRHLSARCPSFINTHMAPNAAAVSISPSIHDTILLPVKCINSRISPRLSNSRKPARSSPNMNGSPKQTTRKRQTKIIHPTSRSRCENVCVSFLVSISITININSWYFPNFGAIALKFLRNEKRRLHHEIKHN